MRLIDADTLGDITVTIDGTVFVRYEDIMNEPIIKPITEADLKELRDRFGDCVEDVVRDMLSGQDERWDEQDIAEADKAYAEYKAKPKTYTLKEVMLPHAELSVQDHETLLVKTDWDIRGTLNRVCITDGETYWKFFYYKDFFEGKSTPLTIEPKRGRWIDTGSGQKCSVCGEIQYGYDNYRYYCPNCGAIMEKEE